MRTIDKVIRLLVLIVGMVVLPAVTLAAGTTVVQPNKPGIAVNPNIEKVRERVLVPKNDGQITDVKVTPENVWYTGTTVKIQWSWPGYVGLAAEVALYRDGTKVATIDPGQTKLYTQWVVPHDAGGSYTVVVRSVRNPANFASAPVGVTDSTLAVASPRPGDKWAIGSKYQVVWSYKGNPGPVKLELTKPDGGGSLLIADNLTGSSGAGTYDWTISDFVRPGYSYQLRVTSMANSRSTALGPYFDIQAPFLALYEPRESNTWLAVGTKVPIKWNWVGDLGPTVNITVTPYNSTSPVLDVNNYTIGSGGMGEYLKWTPPSLPHPQTYTIKLQSVQRSTFISQRMITVNGTEPISPGLSSPPPYP